MISRIKGTLLTRDLGRIEVETSAGVVYEIEVPLTVAGRLPSVGSQVEVRTAYLVREDSATLYGFIEESERTLFTRLLSASGVGAKLALAMLSTYTAGRLARVLAERNIPALTQVSGVGKKKAERIVLELADKVQDLALASEDGDAPAGRAAQEAVAALVALGHSFADADRLVRDALRTAESADADELIRQALGGH